MDESCHLEHRPVADQRRNPVPDDVRTLPGRGDQQQERPVLLQPAVAVQRDPGRRRTARCELVGDHGHDP